MSTQQDAGGASPEQVGASDRAPGSGGSPSAIEQARARARDQVDQRANDLGTRASSVADDLRTVAQHLRSQGREGPAGLVDGAAQRVAGASDYLLGTDGNRLLHDAESLGRRRPWAAIAGGLTAGIAASRFLKASSRERYRTTSRTATAARGSERDG